MNLDEIVATVKTRVIQEAWVMWRGQHLINELYSNIDVNSDLTSNIFPIHYLFDRYINENIGNTIENINHIRENLIFEIALASSLALFLLLFLCNF